MKKLISLALALTLVLSLAIMVSAENAAITGTGTEEDPYTITDIDGTFEITVPAATDPENYEFGMAFLAYPVEAVGLNLNADGGADSEFELSQGFNFAASQDGVASISLSNPMMMGNIRITNYKTEELTLTLTITLPPVGSFGNPAALELGENTATVDLFNGYYMTWTAPAAGTFSITDISLGAEDTEIDFYTINISGDTLYNSDNNVNEETWEPTDDAVIEVDANETVSIEIYAQDYDGVVATATISFNASFAPIVGTESNPIQILNPYDLGGVEAAAGTSTYYAIPGSLMGQIIIIEDVDGMTVTFNGVAAEAVDGVYTLEVAGYPNNQLIITAGDADVEAVAAISYPAGSESNPIQVMNPAEFGGVEAAAGTSTYYAIPGSMMGQVIIIEAADGMTVTFNGVAAEAVDGMYALEIAGYPNNQLIITAGDADVAAVAAISYPAGSESNPIAINPIAGEAEYTTAAGAATYYGIHASYNGNYVIIAGEGITVTVNGQAIEAVDGKFAVELTGAPMNAVVITNDGEADASYTISVGEYTKPVPPTADAGILVPAIVALVAMMGIVALVAKKELF